MRTTFLIAADIAQRTPEVANTLPSIKVKPQESPDMRVMTSTNSDSSSIYLTSVPISEFISKRTKKEPKII